VFKIGALVRIAVRKVWVALSSACPAHELFVLVWANLRRAAEVVVTALRR